MKRFFGCGVLLLLSLASVARAQEMPAEYKQVLDTLGKSGDFKDQVLKVNIPRNDLSITVANVKTPTPFGFGGWVALTKGSGGMDVMMGDLVLTQDEVNPVMSALLDNGLEATALHNHFFWDTPKVMFMHIGGMGSAETLAGAVGKVFATSKETSGGKGTVPHAELEPAKTSLDPKPLEELLGVKGQMANGVYKVTIGRATNMHGHDVGNTMGVNTWAAFAGSDDTAVVDGDFAMLESELQPVLKALRGAGINIVAIHQHMTMESPRVMFLHYWGVGPTRALATGLKAALATQQH